MERDESPASQPPIDDEHLSSPVQGEVLFKEDIQGKVREFLQDDDMSGSMKVSTAELLTQEPSSAAKEKSREVTEITVEKPAEEDGLGVEEVRVEVVEVEKAEDTRQAEEMDEVEPTVAVTPKEASVSIVENSGETAKIIGQMSLPKEVGQSTAVSTTQDDEIAQDDSQQSKLSSPGDPNPTPSIPSAQPLIPQPPSFFPQRHSSPSGQQIFQDFPPKSTPATTSIPASAQIQVKETPLPVQQPAPQPQITFTNSTTRVTATAPSPSNGPTEPVLRGRHKRDRHVGPIIPRFSRRERKMNRDLEAILLEDRKSFAATRTPVAEIQNAVQVETIVKEVVEESCEAKYPGTAEPGTPVLEVQNATQEDTVMEEIVEESFEREMQAKIEPETAVPVVQNAVQGDSIVLEIAKESVKKENPETMESGRPLQALRTTVQGVKEDTIMKETIEESLEPENPETIERKEEIIRTQVKTVTDATLNPQLEETQDDSQTFDAAQSRWGRFATHWRRFTSST